MAAIYRLPFNEGSKQSLHDMAPRASVLEAATRRTLLPHVGFHEALTNLQQWLLGPLVSHTVFDVVNFLLCEIKDTVLDGCRRQLLYAHYLSHIF